jgi:hypothetical protein
MDKVGGADADASSEGAASVVLAAMSSALVRAADFGQLILSTKGRPVVRVFPSRQAPVSNRAA